MAIFIKSASKIVDWFDEYLIRTDSSKLSMNLCLKKYKIIFYMLRFHLNTHNNTVVVPHTKIYILIYRFIILHFRNCKIVNCVCRKVKKNGYVFDAVLKNHAIFKKADLEKDANFLKNMTFISSLM